MSNQAVVDKLNEYQREDIITMWNKVIAELVRLNMSSDFAVFIYYSGHVNSLSFHVSKGKDGVSNFINKIYEKELSCPGMYGSEDLEEQIVDFTNEANKILSDLRGLQVKKVIKQAVIYKDEIFNINKEFPSYEEAVEAVSQLKATFNITAHIEPQRIVKYERIINEG